MKIISFIFLIYFINLVSGFLRFPERKIPSEKFSSMTTVSGTQKYDKSNVKIIETNFDIQYGYFYHLNCSNSPVAPRTDGGYYIMFTDKKDYLHILSYKNK